MSDEKIEFIIDTLETAIEWAEYADDYFKKKHGLEQDRENVVKSIIILRELSEVITVLHDYLKHPSVDGTNARKQCREKLISLTIAKGELNE